MSIKIGKYIHGDSGARCEVLKNLNGYVLYKFYCGEEIVTEEEFLKFYRLPTLATKSVKLVECWEIGTKNRPSWVNISPLGKFIGSNGKLYDLLLGDIITLDENGYQAIWNPVSFHTYWGEHE